MTKTILTPEGERKMSSELEKLKTKRKGIIERIARAKELGDLSENADYQDARDEQSFNEGRIQEIEAILRTATIAEKKHTGDSVGIGCIVTLDNGTDRTKYKIVGSNEASPKESKLSIDSPLVSAMLHKKTGETFTFEAPSGTKKFTIISIE